MANQKSDLVKKQLEIIEDVLYLIKELTVEVVIILKENSHLAKRQLSLLRELTELIFDTITKLPKRGK